VNALSNAIQNNREFLLKRQKATPGVFGDPGYIK
jgi:hypothetical protein